MAASGQAVLNLLTQLASQQFRQQAGKSMAGMKKDKTMVEKAEEQDKLFKKFAKQFAKKSSKYGLLGAIGQIFAGLVDPTGIVGATAISGVSSEQQKKLYDEFIKKVEKATKERTYLEKSAREFKDELIAGKEEIDTIGAMAKTGISSLLMREMLEGFTGEPSIEPSISDVGPTGAPELALDVTPKAQSLLDWKPGIEGGTAGITGRNELVDFINKSKRGIDPTLSAAADMGKNIPSIADLKVGALKPLTSPTGTGGFGDAPELTSWKDMKPGERIKRLWEGPSESQFPKASERWPMHMKELLWALDPLLNIPQYKKAPTTYQGYTGTSMSDYLKNLIG